MADPVKCSGPRRRLLSVGLRPTLGHVATEPNRWTRSTTECRRKPSPTLTSAAPVVTGYGVKNVGVSVRGELHALGFLRTHGRMGRVQTSHPAEAPYSMCAQAGLEIEEEQR